MKIYKINPKQMKNKESIWDFNKKNHLAGQKKFI